MAWGGGGPGPPPPSGVNREAFKYSTFPQILKRIFKNPGALHSKKRFWAA
jgi:hypothetical protein